LDQALSARKIAVVSRKPNYRPIGEISQNVWCFSHRYQAGQGYVRRSGCFRHTWDCWETIRLRTGVGSNPPTSGSHSFPGLFSPRNGLSPA